METQEETQEEKQTPDAEAPAAKKSSKTILLIAIVMVVLVGAAAGVFFFKKRKPAAKAEEKPAAAASEVPKAIMHLETFTVNMNDPEQKAFLRLGVDLGLGKDPKNEKEKEKEAGPPPTALIRDTIVFVLINTKPDDVTTAEGKKALKEQILHALQERLPELQVQNVYFNEFIMQR